MSGAKKLISIRIDPELLDWLKSRRASGYQTLISEVLEKYRREEDGRRLHCAGRAQELFRRFYAQCFWHYDRELRIDPDNIQLVIDGLRKYGGREGLLQAEDLCR